MIVSKKNIYIFSTFIIVNVLTYFLVLPYAQKTANTHMNNGPFFGIIYYSISAFVLVFCINNLLTNRNFKKLLILLLFSVTFIYWGYRLYLLYCLGCANGG